MSREDQFSREVDSIDSSLHASLTNHWVTGGNKRVRLDGDFDLAALEMVLAAYRKYCESTDG